MPVRPSLTPCVNALRRAVLDSEDPVQVACELGVSALTARHWCTMMYRFRRQAGLQHVGRGSIESTRAVVAMHPELV